MTDVNAVEAADRHHRPWAARRPCGELMEQFHRDVSRPAPWSAGAGRRCSSPMPISSPVGSCIRHSPATSGRIDRGSQTDWPRRICCTWAGPRLTSGRWATATSGGSSAGQGSSIAVERSRVIAVPSQGCRSSSAKASRAGRRCRARRRDRPRARACRRPCRSPPRSRPRRRPRGGSRQARPSRSSPGAARARPPRPPERARRGAGPRAAPRSASAGSGRSRR